MSDKPFEHWEQEILQDVEEKLAPIRQAILGLNKAKSEEVAKLRNELLRTQQFVATLGVHYSASMFQLLVLQHRPKEHERFFTQIAAAAAAARSQISSSSDPLPIASKFHAKWSKYIEKLGVPTVELAP